MEIRTISRSSERHARRPRAPTLSVKERVDGTSQVCIDHEDPAEGLVQLTEALGVSSVDTSAGLLVQIIDANGRDAELDELQLNFAASTIAGIGPRDEIEALLATQMVAVHVETMRQLGMLRQAGTLAEMEIYERGANRFARTFAAQVEALRKCRSGGQQKVEVRHVHVNDGGSAIIGAFGMGGGDAPKTRRQPHASVDADGG